MYIVFGVKTLTQLVGFRPVSIVKEPNALDLKMNLSSFHPAIGENCVTGTMTLKNVLLAKV